METLNAVINQVNTILWSYILIVLLIGLGLYFTFRTGFIQIRLLGDMVRLLAEGVGTRRMGNRKESGQDGWETRFPHSRLSASVRPAA